MINIVILFSQFEDKTVLEKRFKNEIETLVSSKFIIPEIVFINSTKGSERFVTSNLNGYPTIVILGSGGTEEYAKFLIEASNKPFLVIANSKQNSLAASLEIKSYFSDLKKLKHYYYEFIDEFSSAIENFILVNNAIDEINSSSLGVIGKPSDWLLTSQNVKSVGSFSTKLIEIDVEEINKIVGSSSSSMVTSTINNQYHDKCVSSSEIVNSSKVYDALKSISKKNNLDALTVRCFDLLKYNYTACMALSILNDENIVSGCEGDIFALFTMLVANKLTNKSVWMANPASINKKENTLILAHCTIPSTMLKSLDEAKLTTHMESGLSVAIQGPLKTQDITILRIGENFDKILFSTGQIVDTDMRDTELCRTQVKIKLNVDVTEWINNSLGNHQILVYGNISDALIDFCSFTNIEIVNNSSILNDYSSFHYSNG